ncbi:ATP-binding protein [Bradyrhizobium liaoningense]|uniref:ATP-binding protein n=1 Tax=Bradyrhizobium liaoningense TaxID=43992 RepID=UPI0020120314|nr:ATP-binding protein [Bradyrhizobium liaoningense]
MRRFFSTTLGQIIAIIATSSAITFVMFLALLWELNPIVSRTPPWPWPPAYRIVNLVEAVWALPESERSLIIAGAQRPDLSIRLTQAPTVCGTLTTDTRDLEAVLRAQLGKAVPNITVRSCVSGDRQRPIQAVIGLGDQMLDIRMGKSTSAPPFHTFQFVGALLFLCVALAAMSTWAVWRVIWPLRRLSEQADAFGRSIAISPIEEEGPLEIRRAARAFNLMQERVTRSLQDRTRMLAAVSHDLRTPLTRMRLQLDTNPTDIAHGKLLRDVRLMQAMVSSALAFLSGGSDQEQREWLDLGALLSTVCDEFEERGADISYQGPQQIRFFCRPNAITRALTNLVENGTNFGSSVDITASTKDDRIEIDVADDGPGIPKDKLKDVLEPFVRLDPARSGRSGSVGLGLSIVKEIVEAHGGTLELIQRQPTGLVVRVTFRIEREEPVSPVEQIGPK